LQKLLLQLALVSCCSIVLSFGEPPLPSPYGRIHLKPPQRSSQEARRIVDQRLLDRVADIISRGGDGSENEPQGTEGSALVNDELLDRISRIISQNSNQQNPQGDLTPGGAADQNKQGGQQGPTNQYGPPSPFISYTYGPPHPQVAKLATTLELGRPFPARRIASFMLEDDDLGRGDNYNNELSERSSYGGQQFQVPQYAASSDSYVSSLPSRFISADQDSQNNRVRFVGEPQMADSIAAFDIEDERMNDASSNHEQGYNGN